MPTPRLTLSDARYALEEALHEADLIGKAMNIAVVDEAGYLLAFARQDTALLASVDIAIGKARTAALLRMPTAELATSAAPGGPLHGIQVTNGGLVIFGGGIPLLAGDDPVGAIGVSAGTVEQDIAVAQAGADAFTTRVLGTRTEHPEPQLDRRP